MALQAYALKIVLGQMAKERCQQNVDILKKIIDSLPPLSVVSEYEKIRCELKKYCNTLTHVNTLLNNTDAAIKSISSKLGKTDGYYRSISTEIVNKALSTLIDVVNSAQENVSTSSIAIIKEAWRVTQRLDNFDMEYEFKIKRYIPNRKILKEIVEQIQEQEAQSLLTHECGDKVNIFGVSGTQCVPTSGYPFQGNRPHNIPTEDDNGDNGGCIQLAIVVIFIVLIFLLLKGCGSDNGASYTSGLGTTSDSDTALLVDTNYSSSYSDELVNNDTLANNDTVTDYDGDSQYESHHLTTGTKPYSNAYGKGLTGENWLDFKTSGSNDYVVIVKKYNSERVINHIYIRGGTSARLYLPNGVYSLYFYSGQGWNPNKTPNSDKPQIVGGFVKYENILKDEPVSLHDQYGEYTLYPVKNGNLSLESSDENEAF